MIVAVLAPWRPGSAERERLWQFTRAWWETNLPEWTIYEGSGPVDGPFNRAAAINEAAEKAGEWDVAVVIDTDTIPELRNTAAAAEVAAAGQMVVAHTRRHMLNQRATAKIVEGRSVGSWTAKANVERVWTDSVSCCVAVSRDLFDRVRGFDPLFVGWGREDTAFRIACEAMSGKPIACLDGESWHLWHTPAPEVKASSPLRKANEARHQRYVEARWNPDAVRVLIDERDAAPEPAGPSTAIPRILHRTLPELIDPQVEAWWDGFAKLHPGWDLRTYREPINPADWPITGHLFKRCQNGAQKAGLIRLEALFTHGGVYVDSDVEPHRSLEPLLHVPAFAAWEDETTVPDAVLGAAKGHPAWQIMLDQATAGVKAGRDAWTTGPGVTTRNLPGRSDVLVLPPGAFYPHHYLEKAKAGIGAGAPWCFVEHRWHHSWGTEAQKRSIAERQR